MRYALQILAGRKGSGSTPTVPKIGLERQFYADTNVFISRLNLTVYVIHSEATARLNSLENDGIRAETSSDVS